MEQKITYLEFTYVRMHRKFWTAFWWRFLFVDPPTQKFASTPPVTDFIQSINNLL